MKLWIPVSHKHIKDGKYDIIFHSSETKKELFRWTWPTKLIRFFIG